MKDMAIHTTTLINHLFEDSSTTKEQSTFKTLVIKYVKDPGKRYYPFYRNGYGNRCFRSTSYKSKQASLIHYTLFP